MAELLVACEGERLLVRHLPAVLHIRKVADEVYDDGRACVLANLFQPRVLDVVEALPTRDVEDEEDAVAAIVEVSCYGAERFLAGRVPDLQLHVGVFAHDHAEVAKLNTDRHTMLLLKGLLG